MPTNVTPEYKDADARYRAAKTDEERLEALEEMASTLNKHKGTEKLYADIKRRIKELREAQEKKAAKRGFAVKVEREGAGQIALAGLPNAGKSSLVAALTKARPEVADYPFTTRQPVPGMMLHENVGLQLLDLPPVSDEYTEPWVYGLIRNADALWLVFDLTAPDPLGDLEKTRALVLEGAKAPLLAEGEVAPEDKRWAAKPTIFVGTRLDVPGAADTLAVVRDLFPGFAVVGVGKDGAGAGGLPRATFDLLRLLRVYAKSPGKEPDRSKPFVLRRGDTLLDFAARVHKDFAENLKYARIWGTGKYDGQRVQRDYVLAEGDVIELHT